VEWGRLGRVPDGLTVSDVGDYDGNGQDDLLLQPQNGVLGYWGLQEDGTVEWGRIGRLPTGWDREQGALTDDFVF